MAMSDETLAEIRDGLTETQAIMQAYSPADVHKAAHYNAVSEFDRTVADTYAWRTVPALLAEVEALRKFVAWVAAEVPDYHASVKQHERARELLNLANEE